MTARALARRGLALARFGLIEARDILLAGLAAAFVGFVRLFPRHVAANACGALARGIGRILPRSSRVGLTQLRLVFPEKSEAERAAILRQSYDNFGRTVAEYCHLGAIWQVDPATLQGAHVEFDAAAVERFIRLRDDGKPAIIIAAHLANWELPMVAAAAQGLDAAALYRAPSNRWIRRWVEGQRGAVMGELVPSQLGAAQRLSAIIADGRHLGLLTDQFNHGGIVAPFFGHPTRCNQIFARLARVHDCPVHAVRTIRLPGDRFRIELTEELALPRDPDGRIDIAGAIGVMNALFESWIREHPGQWLWMHRRWR
jgi:KDO2-lipid IV(A) lauroyltransferase